jgi:PAS domain S-box-containing protein
MRVDRVFGSAGADDAPSRVRVLLALLAPLVALAVQWALWPWLKPYAWFLFYPAIFLSARIGGLRASVLATVLSTTLVLWFFVPPEHSFEVKANYVFPAALFLVVGIVSGILRERVRAASQVALAESRAANAEISRLYEETRLAHERADLAIRGAELGAWDWNIETGELILSAGWYESRGYWPGEMQPRIESWIAGIHPNDRARVTRALNDYLEGRAPVYEVEYRSRTRGGEWRWFFTRGKVFARDREGHPTRMSGTSFDISERKRLEEALRLSEARASGIVSISADAIISVDTDQRITMFNEGAEKIFGYPGADVVGRPLELLIPERFRSVHRRHVAEFAAGPDQARRAHAAIFGLRKSGEEFTAQASISKFAVDGTTLLTVTLRDVTEEKRHESEQEFLAEVGSLLVGSLDYMDVVSKVAELAVDRLADFCFIDVLVGDEVRRLKAASRDRSNEWICDRLMQIRFDRRSPYIVRSVIETRQPLLLQRPSRGLIASFAQSPEHLEALLAMDVQSLMAVPLLAHGKLLGALALLSSSPSKVYGPAELRFAEEVALRAALSIDNARLYQAAQQAIRARDDVLAIVAHDLRNPLGTVLLQSSALRRHEGEAERRSRKPADAIEHAAKRMDRLINDLLDVTRMEAGHLTVQQTDLDTKQVVAESIEAQRGVAAAASVDLRDATADHVPDVSADRDRLLQIFENLIGNAVKFTEPGGTITVGAAPRDHEILFWVADTGSGIPTEDVPHVFERFWQARKAPRRGAGLGLPIVKGLVESHGGRVWVESAPGRGSTFFFTMPAAHRAEPWREAARS